MNGRYALFVVALVLTATSVSNAADKSTGGYWPGWRGSNRDGISTDRELLKRWPEEGPPLAYETRGLGSGYSSLAVVNGRLFTLGKREDRDFLIALNAADGREIWAAEIGKAWSDGPRCTPAVDDGLVYAIGPHGDLICAQVKDGSEVWRKNFAKDFGGKMMSGWGYCESPLVDGEKLICTPGGKDAMVVALDKRTGDVIWKASLPRKGSRGADGSAYSSAVVLQAGGKKQYVQLVGRGVIGIAADNGEFLWGYDKIANSTANVPTPIISENLVFCTSGYGAGSALLRITKAGTGVSADEAYFLNGRTCQNHHGGFVLVDGHVYGGHGQSNGFPICVNLHSGKVVWGGKKRGPGAGSAAVTYADGHLYFRYQNGVIALIEASPRGYALNGKFQIPDIGGAPSWSHPVVTGRRLYLREQDRLLVYDVSADSP